MSRGVAKCDIFRNDEDRRAFLLILRECINRHEWKCLAYCQMGTHYHLLIQTPKANLSAGMRDLNGDYATGFNRRHGRSGALFGGRFKARLVQDNAYLLAAARYVALNPRRGGLVDRAEDWAWGSYAALHGGLASTIVDDRPLFSLLSPDPERARREFIELVADASGLPAYPTRRTIAGDDAFVRRHAPTSPPEQPVLRIAFDEARPPLSALTGGLSEAEFLWTARHVHRYTLREIGVALGCSTETVRRRLKLIERDDLTPLWGVRT